MVFRFFKRLFDIISASLLLLIISPLFILLIILVKFNIRTNYDKWEYLEYKGPESLNEGKAELTPEWPGKIVPPGVTPLEPTTPTKLPNGKNADLPVGIVGIFETDYRSSNDYETEGTH